MIELLHRFALNDRRLTLFLAGLLALASGCLSENSITMRPDQARRIQAVKHDAPQERTAREWLQSAHAQLADLLPADDPSALLTEDFTDANGEPIDVYQHFDINPNQLRSIFGNLGGLKCTARGASQDTTVEEIPAPWPGFDDVWIPIPNGPRLSARLRLARQDGVPLITDCIVILPGYFGDNGVVRTRDLAKYLLGTGHHVLALEMRGHGQTERSQPDVAYTFGVRETDDLMHVADWLQAMPEVERTGLVGFCWSANVAMLAAWYENRPPNDPNITPTLAGIMTAQPDRRRYAAGILAFSPIPQWERLVDDLEVEYSTLSDPVYASLQKTNRERMERKGYSKPCGSMRKLIEDEYHRCGVVLPTGIMEGYLFLRLAPYDHRPYYPKLTDVRIPTVLVHACDDPLSPAQDVVDLIADVDNPQLAGLILPGGGHVGFACHEKEYYFSLISNFFDPVAGATGSGTIATPRKTATVSSISETNLEN